jgi:hypothetical protein
MSGRRSVARSYRVQMLREAVRRESWGLVDLVIRQSKPGRALMVGVSAAFSVAGIFTNLL